MERVASRDDIYRMRNNMFTSWRGFHGLQAWYDKTEGIALRAQLGEISSEEVNELNSVCNGDGFNQVTFMASRSEPALLKAFNTLPMLGFLGFGVAFAGAAKMRGYNNLWFVGAILPATLYYVFNSNRN